MLFCVVLIHAGYIPAIFVFLTWSLPGAIGMFALSIGVQRITNTLPGPVYALLSGLNASTVGIIALAAVQLADKAIKDKMTRILVIGGACAGMCYNALWYFPVLMVIGGVTAVVWDLWAHQQVGKMRAKMARKKNSNELGDAEQNSVAEPVELQHQNFDDKKTDASTSGQSGLQRRSVQNSSTRPSTEISAPAQPTVDATSTGVPDGNKDNNVTVAAADTVTHAIPIKVGLSIIVVFFGIYPRSLI